MKLEVGQKIGIYEALHNMSVGANEPYIIKGQCYLGHKKDDLPDILIFDEDRMLDHMSFVFSSEVRKVGSLIIKRLK